VRELITRLPANQRPRFLRTDNGGEFKSADFESWLRHEGITHQLAPPYTSPYNGLAERYNRSIMAVTRCILYDAGMGMRFWAEAILHATAIINTSPTRSNPDHKSPHELWHGTSPSTRHFRIFGSAGTMMTPGKHRNKLGARTVPVRFLSVDAHSTSTYRVLLLDTGRITHTRNVVFDERPGSAQADEPVTRASLLPLVLEGIDSSPDDGDDLPATGHAVERGEQISPTASSTSDTSTLLHPTSNFIPNANGIPPASDVADRPHSDSLHSATPSPTSSTSRSDTPNARAVTPASEPPASGVHTSKNNGYKLPSTPVIGVSRSGRKIFAPAHSKGSNYNQLRNDQANQASRRDQHGHHS
jgi:hypothetical protein